MKKFRNSLFLSLAAATLVLAGCGESADVSDTGTTETGGATECVPGQQGACDCYDDPSGDGAAVARRSVERLHGFPAFEDEPFALQRLRCNRSARDEPSKKSGEGRKESALLIDRFLFN